MEIKPQSLNCNHPGHTYSKYTTIYLTPNDELLQQAISEGTPLSKKYNPSAPSGRIRNPIERNIKSIYGMLAELSIRLLLQNEIIKRKISAKILPSTMTLVNNTFDNQIDIPLEIEGKHYDIEVNNLRNLMNEIFGEENFLACSTWQKKYGAANDAKGISTTHEYVLIFAKNSNVWIPGLLDRTDEQLTAFKNSDSDLRGPWRASDLSARTYSSKCDYEIIGPTGKKFRPPPSRSWIVNKSKFQELLHDNRITFGKDNDSRPMTKNFLNEVRQGITPDTWWKREKAGDNKEARYELKKIFPENIFDTPKPIKLINLCIKIANCIHDDIILDFFAGSGSTAHATLAANNNDGGSRKFICVQIPEKCPDNSTAQKEGFNTISDICKERIRRVIKKIKDEQKQNKIDSKSNQDLGFKVFKLAKSNYKIWEDVKDETKLKEQLKLFEDPLIKNYKDLDVIYEIIIKEGYSLNSKIEEFQKKPNKIYKISDADFFFYVTLDKQVNSESLEKLKLDNTVMFVCLDSAINDSQKTNLDKLCKLRTI